MNGRFANGIVTMAWTAATMGAGVIVLALLHDLLRGDPIPLIGFMILLAILSVGFAAGFFLGRADV